MLSGESTGTGVLVDDRCVRYQQVQGYLLMIVALYPRACVHYQQVSGYSLIISAL